MNENCQTRRMHGHDYAVPSTYEVTVVVAGRQPVFGEITGTTRSTGDSPRLKPSPLGLAVLNDEIPKIHHYYPMVEVWQGCLMPDHPHMIVRINHPLPPGKHLGTVIGAFKGGISRAWWQIQDAAADTAATVASPLPAVAKKTLPATVSAASAAEPPSSPHRPSLFEPNYNDHILMRDGQLANWKRYLRDNPFRYMMRH